MKRLKKGFTLIELLVVIAIIGILATTLAPKLREQLAKAKDAKAIAVLGAGRTAAQVIFVDKMVLDTASTAVTLAEIYEKLDSKAQDIVTVTGKGTTEKYSSTIGGSRADSSSDVTYGGTIDWVKPTSSATTESVDLNFATNSSKKLKSSTEGKEWAKY